MADASRNTPPGPGVDSSGQAVTDPTFNVLAVIAAESRRQDDLRGQEVTHRKEMELYREECARERRDFNKELREAESSRIDAIRAVDVDAVARAAQVSAAAAATLAAQVAASAEAMRTQVAATATAGAINLTTALGPIQKDIADLRQEQYKAQGQKTQVVEAREVNSSTMVLIGLIVTIIIATVTIVGVLIGTG